MQPYMNQQFYCTIGTAASIVKAILEQYQKILGDSIGSYSICGVDWYNYAEVMLFILCKYWDTARELLSNCLFAFLYNSLLHIIWSSIWCIYSGSEIDKDNVTWVLNITDFGDLFYVVYFSLQLSLYWLWVIYILILQAQDNVIDQERATFFFEIGPCTKRLPN